MSCVCVDRQLLLIKLHPANIKPVPPRLPNLLLGVSCHYDVLVFVFCFNPHETTTTTYTHTHTRLPCVPRPSVPAVAVILSATIKTVLEFARTQLEYLGNELVQVSRGRGGLLGCRGQLARRCGRTGAGIRALLPDRSSEPWRGTLRWGSGVLDDYVPRDYIAASCYLTALTGTSSARLPSSSSSFDYSVDIGS